MNIFYALLILLGALLTGYLLGSLNWAIIISRYVYHIDIRAVGSGNAGGTNVGRAVGRRGALTVIMLDVAKSLMAVWAWFLCLSLTPFGAYVAGLSPLPLSAYYYLAGFGAGLGHVFPLYSRFRGGKAMSCFAGFILATNWLLALTGLGFFLLVFMWRRRVSLSSLLGVAFEAVASLLLAIIAFYAPSAVSWSFFFPFWLKLDYGFIYAGSVILYGGLVFVLHRANIARLARNEEPETHFRREGEKPSANYGGKSEGE